MYEGVGTAGEFNDAWRFRQKTLKDFNILYKQQLTNATCMVHWCISVTGSRTVTWPEGGCVTSVTRWLICLVFCPRPCETASIKSFITASWQWLLLHRGKSGVHLKYRNVFQCAESLLIPKCVEITEKVYSSLSDFVFIELTFKYCHPKNDKLCPASHLDLV